MFWWNLSPRNFSLATKFFGEDEAECTVEMGSGQFRFLVQLRKLNTRYERGLTLIKNDVRQRLRTRMIVRFFAFARGCGENLVEWAAGLFTEDAQEMQKGVRRQAAWEGA